MSRRRLAWNVALRDLKADRLVRTEVREEQLQTAARNVSPVAMSAWRGRSGCRYVVLNHALPSADPADLTDAVVLFIGRDCEGVASILSAHRDLTVLCAEHLIERASADGANEVHVHRLADPHEREAIVADLSPRAAAPTLAVAA